jgi:hypothetical protein
MPPPTARQNAGETDIFKLDGTDICTLGLHVTQAPLCMIGEYQDLWGFGMTR